MTFIDIAAAGQPQTLIPATDITALLFEPQNQYVTIANTTGIVIQQTADQLLPLHDIAQKLADAGYPLQYFPRHFADTGNAIPTYVLPAALQFMTVSQPEKNKNGEDEHGVILGIKGGIYHDICNVKKADIDKLVAAAGAQKTLLSYAPEVASARWYKPETLFIAPEELTHMTFDGRHQLMLSFGSVTVDVQSAHLDWDQQNKAVALKTDSLLDAAQRLRRMKNLPTDNLTDLFNDVKGKKAAFEKRLSANEKKAGFALARELAAYVPQLVEIAGNNALYINPETVLQARVNDTSVVLFANKGASHPESFTVWYDAPGKSAPAFEKFAQDVAARKAVKKPPAPKAG